MEYAIYYCVFINVWSQENTLELEIFWYYFSSPDTDSSPEWTNQSLAIYKDFCFFNEFWGHCMYFYMFWRVSRSMFSSVCNFAAQCRRTLVEVLVRWVWKQPFKWSFDSFLNWNQACPLHVAICCVLAEFELFSYVHCFAFFFSIQTVLSAMCICVQSDWYL